MECPPLFAAPVDILLEILHHLPLSDVRSLGRTSKMVAHHPMMLKVLYREPFRIEDFIEHHSLDAGSPADDRPTTVAGQTRFRRFAAILNDRNGPHVRKMAMSHRSTLGDYPLLERCCPHLHSLDLSHLAEECHDRAEAFSWHDLVTSCPTLLSRLRSLKINISAYTVEPDSSHPNSPGQGGRRRRRRLRQGGMKTLVQASSNLETLALVGPRRTCWAPVECQIELSRTLAESMGPRVTTLQLWDMATSIRNLRVFLEPLGRLTALQTIAINFHETLRFLGRDGDVVDHVRSRDPPAHKDADPCYASTTKDLYQYLTEVRRVFDHDGRWRILPLDASSVHVRHDPRRMYPLLMDEPGQDLLRFMKERLRWKPIWEWDSLMNPAFPLRPTSLAIKSPANRLAEVQLLKDLFQRIRAMGLPVTVELSTVYDRSRSFFSDTSQAHQIEDWCLTDLGCLIDQLVITYRDQSHHHHHHHRRRRRHPHLCPTTSPPPLIRVGRQGHGTIEHWHSTRLKQPSLSAMANDAIQFRPFWRNFAPVFPNLSTLTVCVPAYIDRSWSDRDLVEYLPDSLLARSGFFFYTFG